LPLSASYIQSIRTLTEAVFRRAGIEPNPAKDLRVPKSKTPKVPYLDVHAIRRFFSAESIDAADRLMVACGMGTGLRVGELLSLERADVHLDDHDPHIVIRYGGPDNSPPKGKRVRRVEVFEPALSAWRCWLRDFYRGGDLVFGGERGGYRAAWPEQFKAWAASAGQAKLTSHIMRHTYAVALLNGSWGYKPQPMEFVSRQLGHSSLKITERYYAAWENGSAARDVRIMTQREERPALPLTAAELFGIEVTSDASDPTIQPKKALATLKWVHGRQAPISHGTAENTPDSPRSDGSTHQDLEALARTVLEAARSGDPLFVTRAVELASRVLAAAPDSTRRAVG
jgi:integrase